MPFDLSTAKPLEGGGFDLASARPVGDPREAEVPRDTSKLGAQGEPSLLDRLGSASEKFETLKRGGGEAALAMGTGAAGGAVGNLVGLVRSIASGKFGTHEGVEEGGELATKVREAMTYQPRTDSGKAALKTVGEIAHDTGLESLPPDLGVRPAAAGATGAARTAGGAVKAVGEGAGQVLERAGRNIAPETARLARRAEELGINLRPDMLSDNKFARMIGEALEKVPLSGSKAEQRQIAFNRALIDQIGGDPNAKRITPGVFDQAMETSGSAIGDIAKRHPVPFDDALATQLNDFVTKAQRFEPSDISKIVTNYADDIRRAAKENGGTIPGETLRKINSEIGGQMRRTSNGDLKYALSDLQDIVLDGIESRLSDADRAAWAQARRQYAIGKTIEPMVAKSKAGDMSPQQLMSAMTSDKSKKTMMARGRAGEMGDLARIGQLFLKEPDSSGTTERAVAYGLMGGAGYASLPATAGIYAGANIYNRGGNAVTRRLLNGAPELEVPGQGAIAP